MYIAAQSTTQCFQTRKSTCTSAWLHGPKAHAPASVRMLLPPPSPLPPNYCLHGPSFHIWITNGGNRFSVPFALTPGSGLPQFLLLVEGYTLFGTLYFWLNRSVHNHSKFENYFQFVFSSQRTFPRWLTGCLFPKDSCFLVVPMSSVDSLSLGLILYPCSLQHAIPLTR